MFSLVPLGGCKAMHEFLVLHYMALTVLRNGTPSWTYFCLIVHGLVLEESACHAHV